MSLAIPTVTNMFHIPPIPVIADWSACKKRDNRKNNTCQYIDENKSQKYASDSLVLKDAQVEEKEGNFNEGNFHKIDGSYDPEELRYY